ncbi:hypothetical protein [Flexistipes sp.]|uniref:hypothetical protein n=1 Tax=Flexistipes sp. TaxID=3088135 RepID=UPI002E1D8C84|nr:hypothetical protein [Flexistipes sp.]
MICESSYWKDKLISTASFLKEKKQQKQWRASSYAKVEQEIIISFYSIRKLMDSNKLSENIIKYDIPVVEYSARDKQAFFLNIHKIDELYELDKPKEKSIKLRSLCNIIVHSYIFQIVTKHDNKGFDSILFNSDYTKDKVLYCILVDELIKIIETIGQNYPWKFNYKYDWSMDNFKIECK